jgi:UDP-N-acetylmuramate-alanine ligase
MSSIPKILHSAYTFVRSAETTKAISAVTIDHLIQTQIQSLKAGEKRTEVDQQGSTLVVRISRWDRLDVLVKDMDAVVKAVKEAGNDEDQLSALGLGFIP